MPPKLTLHVDLSDLYTVCHLAHMYFLEHDRYLRREKDIADSKVDVVETEAARFRQRCETLEKQIEATNKDLAEERQKAQVISISLA